MKKKLLFLLSFVFAAGLTMGQITSVATGNWNDAATWDIGIPTSTDDVVINTDVVVDNDAECKGLTINSGKSLSISNSLYTLTTSATVEINGTLTISAGVFNAGDGTSDFLYVDGGTLTQSGGTINVAGRFYQKNSGYTNLSGSAILNISTQGQQIYSYNNLSVTTGNFDVASSSSVQIVLKNGHTGTATPAIYFSPDNNGFNGGSLIIENATSIANTYIDSDHNIYKIESDVGAGNTLNFAAGCSFTLSNFTITSGNVQVDAGATMDITTPSLGTDDVLTIESGASVIFGTAPTEKIKVQRSIAAWPDPATDNSIHGWHLISSPVTSQAVQPEFVPTTPTTNEDFYYWKESTHEWINSKEDDGSGTIIWNSSFDASFVVGKGYLCAYASDVTKTFDGVSTSSDVAISSLTKTTFTPTWSTEGWNLIGNPYTSGLTWNIGSWTSANIDGTAKIWDEANASYTDEADGTGVIPPMQGFMVHVNNTSGGSLTLAASDRVHNTSWYKNDSIETNKIKLTVYDTDNNTAQESIIKIIDDATSEFDTKYDSHFLPGFAPQFYSVLEDGTAVSTNALPDLTESTVIPFSFIKNSATNYKLQAEGINDLVPAQTVYLTDLKTNYTQKLNDNPVYQFTSEEGDIAERFELHFGPLGINDNKTIENRVNVFAVNNQVEIRSKSPLNAVVYVYNITGQLIAKTVINNQSSASINTGDFSGIAIISVIDNNQVFNQKVLIK